MALLLSYKFRIVVSLNNRFINLSTEYLYKTLHCSIGVPSICVNKKTLLLLWHFSDPLTSERIGLLAKGSQKCTGLPMALFRFQYCCVWYFESAHT